MKNRAHLSISTTFAWLGLSEVGVGLSRRSVRQSSVPVVISRLMLVQLHPWLPHVPPISTTLVSPRVVSGRWIDQSTTTQSNVNQLPSSFRLSSERVRCDNQMNSQRFDTTRLIIVAPQLSPQTVGASDWHNGELPVAMLKFGGYWYLFILDWLGLWRALINSSGSIRVQIFQAHKYVNTLVKSVWTHQGCCFY